MEQGFKIKMPLEKPVMIFDGECGFCRFCIQKLMKFTVEGVDYIPFQNESVPKRFPEIPPGEFDESVQFIEPGGKVFSGAEAIFRSLATDPKKRVPFWFYHHLPGVALLTEWGYKKIAKHRCFFSTLLRTNRQ